MSMKYTIYDNLPSRLIVKDGKVIRKDSDFKVRRIVNSNYYRKTSAEIQLQRRKAIKQLVKKYPSIDRMNYNELMKTILFEDKK